MGMSGDFETGSSATGATHVRVGTAVFGGARLRVERSRSGGRAVAKKMQRKTRPNIEANLIFRSYRRICGVRSGERASAPDMYNEPRYTPAHVATPSSAGRRMRGSRCRRSSSRSWCTSRNGWVLATPRPALVRRRDRSLGPWSGDPVTLPRLSKHFGRRRDRGAGDRTFDWDSEEVEVRHSAIPDSDDKVRAVLDKSVAGLQAGSPAWSLAQPDASIGKSPLATQSHLHVKEGARRPDRPDFPATYTIKDPANISSERQTEPSEAGRQTTTAI